MNNHTQVAPSAFVISNISIKQDAQGRYCLNDLHKAAIANGSNAHTKEPTKFLSSPQAIELISELDTQNLGVKSVSAIKGRSKQQGTYVVKELVYAYAMWISASFSLKVIRAYDALQSQPFGISEQLPKPNPLESFQTRVLVCVEKGVVSQQVVPFGSCVIDPEDPVAVATFIRECVPSNPQMLSALSSAYITKLMNCQDAAINHLKPKEHRRE